MQDQFELYVSTLVINEISAGDPQAADRRLSAIQGIAILAIPDQSMDVADALLAAKALPEKAREDALHIGIAAVQGMDYLLTWNFKHINNAHKKAQVVGVVERFALACPVLYSPRTRRSHMTKDPIIEELHRYREAHALKYGNDLRRICEALRKKEAQYPVVNQPPKPLSRTTVS